MVVIMGSSGLMVKWRKAPVMLRPRQNADPVFGTGAASLYLPAFHNWSGWQELHLRPPRSKRGRLLLTIHPENGCQGWTRTNTKRLNRPPCYFDTTWQWLVGAAGRSRTCIGSFRRRTPRLFRPRQHFEKWSEQQEFHLGGSPL